MKARVKFNNEVIDVIQVGTKTHLYDIENVEFLDNPQDYWEKLKHQAAISAMQGILANPTLMQGYAVLARAPITSAFLNGYVLAKSVNIATELVEKLKNE